MNRDWASFYNRNYRASVCEFNINGSWCVLCLNTAHLSQIWKP